MSCRAIVTGNKKAPSALAPDAVEFTQDRESAEWTKSYREVTYCPFRIVCESEMNLEMVVPFLFLLKHNPAFFYKPIVGKGLFLAVGIHSKDAERVVTLEKYFECPNPAC